MSEVTVKEVEIKGSGWRFSIEEDGMEVGRARLYAIQNDIHEGPFGYVEDVHVEEAYRGRGLSKKLMEKLLEKARELGFYKVILHTESDNFRAQSLYTKSLGFYVVGPTLRLDL
ncbi:MAG: hypothetical protein A3C03_00105 [Candidatus Colwellbacteria bacterium RIFCSPHIGHO2_02_FULL_45_17]|uniref:N-acetyltransferase domain-containing protein n=2 Tax=Candidatus Colwelliibacteriota TaxID=1817904 RepID=A0A1G1ZEY3_9BACT|nr:MAG: hypothetical protein A3C03_00105 [Candidatus Colwellbacteria bacterium RIFCSPHIGHO2_02_FULL_45_17]OGY61102.1 MAG: hypothetical protein A3I33_01255 [Candidatus Colwellbacteria bacterium RIFCSPLOWO2_02_FULL_45_11]OGY62520.1 MAG: hypothetical protein A3G58_02675 [Candidatus Colwellbacteria bacterium RIFCSPLOWO2_12_FULL_46_17]